MQTDYKQTMVWTRIRILLVCLKLFGAYHMYILIRLVNTFFFLHPMHSVSDAAYKGIGVYCASQQLTLGNENEQIILAED